MNIPNLRSPRAQVGGLYHFGRMLDKIRLQAAGQLPDGYKLGTEDFSYWDGRVCRFLLVDYADVEAKARAGEMDDAILAWCFQSGRQPNEEELMIFNTFLEKRGWRDAGSESVAELKEEMGMSDRDDIQTMFEAIDADEGRL